MAENRYAKYAQPAGNSAFIADPRIAAAAEKDARAAEAERQRIAIAQRQAEIAQQNANTSAANAAVTAANATKPKEGYRQLSDGSWQFIPGGPADPTVIAQTKQAEAAAAVAAKAPKPDPERLAQIRSILGVIADIREKAKEPLSTGKFAEGVTDIPLIGRFIGQNRADLEGMLQTVQGDIIQQQIARLSALNGGNGVTGLANQAEEAKRVAASIANIDPNQREAQFLEGLQRAEDYYRRQEDATKRQLELVHGGGNTAAGAGATEKSVPINPEYQRDYTAWVHENAGNLNPEAYAFMRAELDKKYGYDVTDPSVFLTEGKRIREQLDKGGKLNLDIPNSNERMTVGEQATNDFLNTGVGRAVTAYANSATGGILEHAPGARENLELMRDESSGEMGFADLAGGLTGTFFGGKVLGGASGLASAAPGVSRILANPITADAAYGAFYGANDAGSPWGAVTGVAGALLGNTAGRAIGHALPRITGTHIPNDPLSRGERAVLDSVGDIDPVVAALREAEAMNVPATIADVSPNANSLTGAALRRNPTNGEAAREMLARRSRGQIDRFQGAVERDLGQIGNVPQRSEDLITQARAAAGPLYDQAYAAPGAADFNIADLLQRPSMQNALNRAARIAQEEGRNPYEMGFVFDETGNVQIPGLAGRYADAAGPRPTSGSAVISGKGNRAPSDLVTFVRQNGGLMDQGGELKFMGMDNATRRGVGMAGQDAKFGKLVDNEAGRELDDMAERAWEAGYFGPPETTPRPSTDEFLNALEDTYTGNRRVFSFYDDATAAEYNAAEENLNAWRNAEGTVNDISEPAGPDVPFAPIDAYGALKPVSPTWQTFDYTKRGLDDVVEGYRDPTSGKLNLDTEGRAVNDTLRSFLGRIDEANPAYAAARAAYAGPAAERAAMQRGQAALRVSPNQLGVDIAGSSPAQMGQMRLGFQSALSENANRLGNNFNPFRTLDTPQMEQRLATMYADDGNVARLLAQRDLEGRLAGSTNRLVGNSLTAERQVADRAFDGQSLAGDVLQGAAETLVTGAPVATVLRSAAGRGVRGAFNDYRQLGFGRRATELADEIVPFTLNEASGAAADRLTDISQQAQAYDPVVQALMLQARNRASRLMSTAGTIINTRIF